MSIWACNQDHHSLIIKLIMKSISEMWEAAIFNLWERHLGLRGKTTAALTYIGLSSWKEDQRQVLKGGCINLTNTSRTLSR